MLRLSRILGHAYVTGGAIDARLRARSYRGRARWILGAVFYYVAFIELAPYAILLHPGYKRMIESLAFALTATAVTWLVVRLRAP